MKVSFVYTFICFVNILMKVVLKVLNRTKVLYGSSDQSLGEINNL